MMRFNRTHGTAQVSININAVRHPDSSVSTPTLAMGCIIWHLVSTLTYAMGCIVWDLVNILTYAMGCIICDLVNTLTYVMGCIIWDLFNTLTYAMCCIIWDLVSTVTYATGCIIRDQIPARGNRFCTKCPDLLCSRGTEVPSPSSKWTRCEGHHSSTSRAEVMNEWSYTSNLPLCLCGMHRDNSTFFILKAHYTAFSFNTNSMYCVRLELASKMMTNHHSMLTFCDVLHAPL
jgi:hypothetical protein